ncbi:MAG TPA: hypothetical protein VFA09_06195 [Ktedonobacteraceae bacterium]|nr:hypothetical protein [Ktedonobacteraceae bacterium]
MSITVRVNRSNYGILPGRDTIPPILSGGAVVNLTLAGKTKK